MSSNTYLMDASSRHAVFIQRYAGGQSKAAEQFLNRLRREIVGRLADEPTAFQYGRLNALLIDVDAISTSVLGDMEASLAKMTRDLVVSEAAFSSRLMEGATTASFSVPSSELLIAAVSTTSLNMGSDRLTVDQALSQFGAAKKKEVTQMIKDGMVLGDTTPQISRKVSTTINTLYKRQSDALVRTAVNGVSNIAREQVYNANNDILDGYEWVATLDSRTTFICGSRDGQTYPLNSGPVPPAHWNCRSTTIPKVKKQYDKGSEVKGNRPSNGSDGTQQVSGQSNYSGWLRRQSKEFQNEALGPKRAELFRKHQVGMKGFVDPTGRTYTLPELEATYGLSLGGKA